MIMESRETMDVDVLFVGGGAACLSSALHLANLIQKHNEEVTESGEGRLLEDITLAVLDKGKFDGAHSLSGAIMDPCALKDLIPDLRDAPLESGVIGETVLFLTKENAIKSPVVPPFLKSHGCYVVSLSKLTSWIAEQADESGVMILPGFAAVEVLYDANRIIGVRTGDKGVDSDGTPKNDFEPGIDIHAKVTVFGEGARGSLTKSLLQAPGLAQGKNPQTYVIGIKEVWDLPGGILAPGEVIHTAGFPLKQSVYGGGFVYGMKDNLVSLGLIVGLGYKDPGMFPHEAFQKLKCHPRISRILKGGVLLQYGAKTVPVGGFFAIPKLALDGGLLIGDGAGLFNSQRIKGIHLAMKSGMLAAETIYGCIVDENFSESKLQAYENTFYKSKSADELYRARNYHQAFHRGFFTGVARTGLQYAMAGRDWRARLRSSEDHTSFRSVKFHSDSDSGLKSQPRALKESCDLILDRESDLFYAGIEYEENQPIHLKVNDINICTTTCWEKFRSPCRWFCPAQVYEIELDESSGNRTLTINPANCIHCKTCDIKDPFKNITWVPPEGGSGPKYSIS